MKRVAKLKENEKYIFSDKHRYQVVIVKLHQRTKAGNIVKIETDC